MLRNVPSSVKSLFPNVNIVIPGSDQAYAAALVNNPNMIGVWASLIDRDPEGFLAADFFELIVRSNEVWSRISKTPTKAAQSRILEIQKKIEELADLLPAAMDDITLFRGRPLLTNDTSEREGRAIENPTELLTRWASELTEAVRYESEAVIIRPRKVNQDSAERTYLIRALAQFYLDRTGEANCEHIADVISTIQPTPIDSNAVYKLCGDLWREK